MEKQDVRVMSSRAVTEEEERFQRFRVMLQQTGGDPSAILELLSTIVKKRDWRHLPDELDGSQTFLGYFKHLGWSKDDLVKFVGAMHHRHERPPNVLPPVREEMAELRRQIRDLTNPKLPPVGPPKGSQNAAKKPELEATAATEEIKGSNRTINSETKRGTTSAYLTKRLKRDAPDLAEKVISGEMSPRRAAIQAGFVTPEFSIPDDPHKAARRVLNRFKGERLREFIRILANHEGLTLIEPETSQ